MHVYAYTSQTYMHHIWKHRPTLRHNQPVTTSCRHGRPLCFNFGGHFDFMLISSGRILIVLTALGSLYLKKYAWIPKSPWLERTPTSHQEGTPSKVCLLPRQWWDRWTFPIPLYGSTTQLQRTATYNMSAMNRRDEIEWLRAFSPSRVGKHAVADADIDFANFALIRWSRKGVILT